MGAQPPRTLSTGAYIREVEERRGGGINIGSTKQRQKWKVHWKNGNTLLI